MRILILILILIMLINLSACGKQGPKGDSGLNGSNGQNGSSCKTTQLPMGAMVTCGDGSFAIIYNGQQGAKGESGIPGEKGASCSVSSTSTGADIGCTDGTVVSLTNGLQGATGTNGTDCSVQQLSNGARISCGQQIAYVYDGEDAPITAFTFTQEITPCGKESSPWKEVLLCMSNGQILASFSDDMGGTNTRLANIPPGSYMDTDKSGCNFNVTLGENSSSVVTWQAGSNQYSSWASNTVVCNAN